MMGVAYYNEHDPKAALWLRNLIASGLLPPGEVDERSISEVAPDDLQGFTQCHFFAGIGGWPLALQLAGWPAARPVWTGSCPCQPFSIAGKRKGEDDERHLWPVFRTLLAHCHPSIVFGEQVASADGRLWLSGIRADLEALGYEFGAADLCAAGIGAPHIRQRLYWGAGRKGDANRLRTGRDSRAVPGTEAQSNSQRLILGCVGDCAKHAGPNRRVSDTGSEGLPPSEQPQFRGTRWRKERRAAAELRRAQTGWGDHWIACADGKARRIEPGLSPLADGIPARVVRLRGYGNAIVPALAAEFIAAWMEAAA